MKKQLAFACAALALAAGTARAELKIDISTPPVIVVKHAMEQRTSRLVRFYEPGILGLAKNGDIAVRDGSRMTLVQRQTAEKLIDAENSDRKALVYAIATGNHQPDAMDAVRTGLIKQWREHWKSGWYLQDDAGNWIKKP